MLKIFPSSSMIVFEDNAPYNGSFPSGDLIILLRGDNISIKSRFFREDIVSGVRFDEIKDQNGQKYGTTAEEVRDALNVFFLNKSGNDSGNGIVAFNSDRSQISIVSGSGFINDLPPLTQTFEAGTYEIRYNGLFSANGPNVRGLSQIKIDNVVIINVANGLSSNLRIPATTYVEVDLDGEHTIEFLVSRNGDAGRTVLLERRYYIIQKIN